MNKYNPSNGRIDFQKARFFRRRDNNDFAYCIEPFEYFDESYQHESVDIPNNPSIEKLDRIKKIAHFGYGYTNHTDVKWYAITQLMIWQAADQSGDYYFTNGLNGNRINPYQNEIDEINYLINQYEILPSISNQNYTIVEGKELLLEDTNNVIHLFQTNDKIEKINNKIIIKNLNAGEYQYNFFKNDNIYNKPLIFYQSNNSQNLIQTGDLETKTVSFKVNVIKTNIEITKIDKTTQEITPQGDAELDGAIINLYNNNNEKINEYKIENNQIIINNIDFGKYYIKEALPGKGYQLNHEKFYFEISKENPRANIIVENKVIEKTITIDKKYGETNNLQPEKNIQFNIIDKNNEIIKTIQTDEKGKASITLPYGSYKISQINTTAGYNKVEDFYINIEDEENETIELNDMIIPIPNTHTETNQNILFIIIKLLLLII